MKQIILLFFILLNNLESSGQLKSIYDFLDQLNADSSFRIFKNKFYPSFGVAKYSESTLLNKNNNLSSYSVSDTTSDMINTTSTLQFKAHPFFKHLSVSGRLEMFKSVCIDGTCVGEVSSQLFLTFETKSKAELVLNILLDTLCPLSSRDYFRKTNIGDLYSLSASEKEAVPYYGSRNYVSLILLTSSNSKYEIYIGQSSPKLH